MGRNRFSDDFKRDAVAQITQRGCRGAEVSERLGVSQHSLYAWKREFGKPDDPAPPLAPTRCVHVPACSASGT